MRLLSAAARWNVGIGGALAPVVVLLWGLTALTGLRPAPLARAGALTLQDSEGGLPEGRDGKDGKEGKKDGKDGKEDAPGEAGRGERAEVKDALMGLKQALAARDSEQVAVTAARFAHLGGEENLKVILVRLLKIPPEEDAIYWALIRAAASFEDREALKALGRFLDEKQTTPLARDLLVALSQNRSSYAFFALRDLVLAGPEDLRPLAATSIARTRSRQTVDLLIELLKSEEKAGGGQPTGLTWIAADGLKRLTGQDFGPSSVNWEGWWKQNREKPLRIAAEGGAGGAAATGTAVDFVKLDPLRQEQFFGVEKAPPQRVVVLSAHYTKKLQRDLNNDHMENVLSAMGVPHTVVRREDFLEYDLSETGVVLINCAQFHEFCICPTCKPSGSKNNRLYVCSDCNKHDIFKSELSGEAIKKLHDFVMRGGYLFCEDWTIKEVVERAFPKFAAAGPKLVRVKPQGDGGGRTTYPSVVLAKEAVDVVPVRGMGMHPYLDGIFKASAFEEEIAEVDDIELFGDPAEDEPRGKTIVVKVPDLEVDKEKKTEPEPVSVAHRWTVDDESFAFKIVNRRQVLPLLASGDVQSVTSGHGVVALAFRPAVGPAAVPPGQAAAPGAPGVVTVVLSHFGKQSSTEDEHSIQNILLNVLMDAHENQRPPRGGVKPAKRGAEKDRKGEPENGEPQNGEPQKGEPQKDEPE